jgi:general secretion pathway protein G
MTLIEIMIVLAIIALVMGLLVGPAVLRQHRVAQAKTARLMTRQIESAYERWRVDSSAECPGSIHDLREELGRHRDDPIDDPWGHPYVMKCDAPLPAGCDRAPCVYSLGPDGKEGSEDDIGNWATSGTSSRK